MEKMIWIKLGIYVTGLCVFCYMLQYTWFLIIYSIFLVYLGMNVEDDDFEWPV